MQWLSGDALIRPDAGPFQLEKDIRTQSCNSPFMELQTGRVFEPEAVEIDGYWVHVAVTQDLRFPDYFQCEVALYSREVDSDWSDLDLNSRWTCRKSFESSGRLQLPMNTGSRWDTY